MNPLSGLPTSPTLFAKYGPRSAAALGGFLVSAVVHVVVLTILAFVSFANPVMPTLTALDAGLDEQWAETLEDDAWLQRPSTFQSGGPAEGGGSKGTTLTAPVTSAGIPPNFSALASIDAPVVAYSSEGPVNLGAPLAEKASGFGQGNGAGIGNGTGNGVGDGTGSYFAIKPDKKSFVFVVDASSSMNRPYPGIARTRFGRVKLELLKTISQLTPEQQFFVIFFSDEAFPMPARDLVSATSENQRSYMEWVAQARALGATHPETAVVMALKLKPDIVYFLTDGNFDRDTVKAAKRHNLKKIPIHTIGFGDNDGEDRLKEIATLSGGTYRFIPEEAPEQQAAIVPGEKLKP